MTGHPTSTGEMPRERGTGQSMSAAAAELFKAVAHPVRAQILELLCRGESSIPQLCEGTGVKTSHLSRHLSQMRGQHLIQCLRVDGRLVYRLSYPEVAELVHAARSVLQTRTYAAVASVGHSGPPTGPGQLPVSGMDASPASGIPPQATFSDEQFAALEATLASRSVIADACEAIAARSNCSLDTAARQLIITAHDHNLTLREAAAEELRHGKERRQA